jgi:hypothetical protein
MSGISSMGCGRPWSITRYRVCLMACTGELHIIYPLFGGFVEVDGRCKGTRRRRKTHFFLSPLKLFQQALRLVLPKGREPFGPRPHEKRGIAPPGHDRGRERLLRRQRPRTKIRRHARAALVSAREDRVPCACRPLRTAASMAGHSTSRFPGSGTSRTIL